VAKGLSSGYQPIGGVLIGDRVADVLLGPGGEFHHGFTYSGHPVACAVASVALRIYQEEKIIERVQTDLAPYFAQRWSELAAHPLVGDARATGLLGALELVRDKAKRVFFEPRGEVATWCRDLCVENGLVMRAVRDTMIVSPPLVITRAQIDELVEKAWRCLDLTMAKVHADVRFRLA